VRGEVSVFQQECGWQGIGAGQYGLGKIEVVHHLVLSISCTFVNYTLLFGFLSHAAGTGALAL